MIGTSLLGEACRIRTPNLSQSTDDKDASVICWLKADLMLYSLGRNTHYLHYLFPPKYYLPVNHLPPAVGIKNKWCTGKRLNLFYSEIFSITPAAQRSPVGGSKYALPRCHSSTQQCWHIYHPWDRNYMEIRQLSWAFKTPQMPLKQSFDSTNI